MARPRSPALLDGVDPDIFGDLRHARSPECSSALTVAGRSVYDPRMRSRFWVVLSLFAVMAGCMPSENFHARVVQGCRSAAECMMLHQEATSRFQECQNENIPFVGFLRPPGPRCAGAEADVRATLQYFNFFQLQAERDEEARRRWAAQQTLQQQEAWAKQYEAQRILAEQQQLEARWLALDPKGCAERGERPTCEELRVFIVQNPSSTHQKEAASALEAGRARIAEAHEEQARRAAEEEAKRARSRPRSTPPAGASSAGEDAGSAGRVCCCDGTISPTCTYVHRGCCSHHGGVCGCR